MEAFANFPGMTSPVSLFFAVGWTICQVSILSGNVAISFTPF
jgi:hypothetical protein